MHNQNKNDGFIGNTFVVIGGLGYVGAALCLELVKRGAHEVRSLDTQLISSWKTKVQEAGVQLIQGDVRERKDVEKALRGADCVFHLASYGMSGKQMLQSNRIEQVNIHGTRNVLDACHENGIKRLVYISTYNVIFGGKEIINGDESIAYFPLDEHPDPYGRSKSIAEQLVLRANGRPSKKNNDVHLHTCAIRPNAIYGPGEERHLPKIASLAKMGLLFFRVGDSSIKSDCVYVDNLVHSLILANIGLLDNTPSREQPIAAGQAYFISDGLPVNVYDFMVNSMLKCLGHDFPKITVDVKHALIMSRIIAVIYRLLSPWLTSRWLPEPLLLPTEVAKLGVTHYFSCQKAKEELGYTPVVSPGEGLNATLSYWLGRKKQEFESPTLAAGLCSLLFIVAHFCAAFLPTVGPFKWVYAFYLFVFHSLWMIRATFCFTIIARICEATYAWNLARRVDSRHSTKWFWQSLALGYTSWKLLLKKGKCSD